VSTTPTTFPFDLSYQQFFTFLASQDCTDGDFLITTEKGVQAVKSAFPEDLGRQFYDSGLWRNAGMYICATNLSNTTTRGKVENPVYLAGVNMSGADLSSTDLSKVSFTDTLTVQGQPYTLIADLTGVIYNGFTTWPVNFVPPPPTEEKMGP
jgi:uncharacterized protein YjbI with pentapeptide repeats